jgi:hypothetical protein
LIRFTTDTSIDLSIFSCTGQLSADEIMKTVKSIYEGMPSRNIIWDLAESDVSSITADEVRELARGVKKLAHSREGGKTAIVSPKDISYGIGRMYQIFAEIYSQSAQIEVFRSKLEAERWVNDKYPYE